MKPYNESLVKENLNIARHIAHKWESTGIEYDDLQSMAFEGLVKASATFDESKGVKFATYAARCMENEIIMYLRKKRIRAESLYNEISEGVTIADTVADNEDFASDIADNDALRYALGKITEEERCFIELLYVHGMKQETLAKMMGVSQNYVSRKARQILDNIRNIMDGFAPKRNKRKRRENECFHTISMLKENCRP